MTEKMRVTGMLLAAMAAGYVGGLMSQANTRAVAAGTEPVTSDVVRANRFELVNDKGAILAQLRANSDGQGSTLVMFGPDGSGSVLISSSDKGPSVYLQKGESSAMISAETSNSGSAPQVGVSIGQSGAILTVSKRRGVLLLSPSTGAKDGRLLTPNGDE